MKSPVANIPELVSTIAHQLVSSDIRGAGKLRGISWAFKNAIRDDIVLHQPKEVLKDSGKITRHLIPRNLYCRVKKRNDVHDALLVRLSKMDYYLCEKLEDPSPTKQNETLQALCRGHFKINGYKKYNRIIELRGPRNPFVKSVKSVTSLPMSSTLILAFGRKCLRPCQCAHFSCFASYCRSSIPINSTARVTPSIMKALSSLQ